MALFASGNDARLIRSVSREIMQKMISIEVEIFKIALTDTEINLYSESELKVYYSPVRLYALIRKDESSFNDVDTGMDLSQTVSFSFLRDDLKDINFTLEEGDIIKFDERYYEVDNTRTTNYWAGRNPDTLPINVEGRDREFGYNISITASTHLTRLSNIQLVDIRSGITPIHRKTPKNI